jgi:Bacterial Ig-like domain (group 3)
MNIPGRISRLILSTIVLAGTGLAMASAPASAAVTFGNFTSIIPGFTQEIWSAPTSAFGGVVVRGDGTVIASECRVSGSPLHFISPTLTTNVNGFVSHVDTSNPLTPRSAGCGLLLHPDGYLYTNTGSGVLRLNRNTGAIVGGASAAGFDPAGNIRSIALDPVTNHIFYGSSSNNRLFEIDVVANTVTQGLALPAGTTFIDGLHFSKDGQFIFVVKRAPGMAVMVLRRDGTFVQEFSFLGKNSNGGDLFPDGLVIHKDGWVGVSTHQGALTRLTFPGNDYAAAPIFDIIASGGFKFDLADVGPDGCAYMTADGLRYPDGLETSENSISRVCGGFEPGFDLTKPDNAAPVISIATPSEGQNFALNNITTAGYSCQDASVTTCDAIEGLTGFATGPGGQFVVVAIDTKTVGAHKFTVKAVDSFGNTATKTVNYTVGTDAAAPTVAIASPTEGASFTLGQIVNAGYTCADDFALATCVGNVATGTAIDTATLGAKIFTVTATDASGKSTTKTTNYTVVLPPDTTNPLVTLTAPADGAVFTTGQVVNAAYTCADDRALASCIGTVANGAAIDTATAGSKSFTVTAKDAAGNTSVRTVAYTVNTPADTVAPTITINSPIDGGSYTVGAGISAQYGCIDDRALASCVGTVANGVDINTSTVGTKTFTVTAKDAAGNTATKSVSYTVKLAPDTIAPVVVISSPADGAQFTVGDIVAAAFTCDDDRSMESCIATVPNGSPINTSAAGTFTFTATAKDTAGNTSTKTTTYTVVKKPDVNVGDPTEWFELGGMGEWRQFYLGYGNVHAWEPKLNPAAGRTTLEVQFRDVSGDADWTKIKVRPQTHPEKMVPVADYIVAGTDTKKWFTVSIPLAAFGVGAFDNLSELGIFQEAETGRFDIGMGTVRFTGGSVAPFEWFGPSHNDNVIEANHVQGQLVAERHTAAGADAAVNLNIANKQYKIYEPIFADITITNTGKVAKNFTVNMELPPSVVFCYGTVSQGEYVPWPGRRHEWKVGVLQPGQTATARVALFPLLKNRPLTFIAQAAGYGDFDMATVTG